MVYAILKVTYEKNGKTEVARNVVTTFSRKAHAMTAAKALRKTRSRKGRGIMVHRFLVREMSRYVV